jgi:hypothetical protein
MMRDNLSTIATIAVAASLPLITISTPAAAINFNPPAMLLSSYTVDGTVAISDAFYSASLNGLGQAALVPHVIPGEGYEDYGLGFLSASGGYNPSIFIGAQPANNGGGTSYLEMTYQVAYWDPGIDPSIAQQIAIAAGIGASDVLTYSGGAGAVATATVSGPSGQIFSAYDCVSGNIVFSCNSSAKPFPNLTNVTMYMDTAYTVTMMVQESSEAGNGASSEIDPTFSVSSATSAEYPGEFLFSPGLVATPLPAALPLFASGLGVIGMIAKRRKRKNAAAIAA